MIRAYQKGDDDQIVKLWRKSSDLAHPFLSKSFQDQEAKNIRNIYLPNTKTWVFEVDGQIYGFMSMIENEIGGLFVDPSAMKGGIGASLVAVVRPLYPSLLVKVFERNSIGRGFYAKQGFQQVAKELHEETGEMLLVLELENN